jgi:hypothetical protein
MVQIKVPNPYRKSYFVTPKRRAGFAASNKKIPPKYSNFKFLRKRKFMRREILQKQLDTKIDIGICKKLNFEEKEIVEPAPYKMVLKVSPKKT